MIFRTVEVAGFYPAIMGMRNPKNSWDKMDSDCSVEPKSITLGTNDKKLSQALICGGPVHSKFLRQVQVWVDIEAPLYWWSEFDTYKVGVSRNSCSTMHKLLDIIRSKSLEELKEQFQIETDFENEVITEACSYLFEIMGDPTLTDNEKLITMKRILPSSYLQKATICMSYENIRSMIRWRQNHRLSEWSVEFINWAKSLPLADEWLFYNNEVNDN